MNLCRVVEEEGPRGLEERGSRRGGESDDDHFTGPETTPADPNHRAELGTIWIGSWDHCLEKNALFFSSASFLAGVTVWLCPSFLGGLLHTPDTAPVSTPACPSIATLRHGYFNEREGPRAQWGQATV